jgi:hypothetical protein
MMVDIIIPVAAIVLIVGGAVAYIVRAKKKGQKCIGCPYSSSCAKSQEGKCTCISAENK